jgi:hypothetical protein
VGWASAGLMVCVVIGRGFEIESFVWPLVVKFLAEAVELTLLSGQISCRRAGGFRFQGTTHALVTTILLGFARLDELGLILRAASWTKPFNGWA